MARTKYAQIRQDCSRIKAMWAKGYDDERIRTKLGLTRSKFETRLKYIALDRFDNNRNVVLLQYEVKKQRRYDQLEAIIQTTKDEKLKLECIKEMGVIDDSFITMAQRLGILPEAPKKFAGVVANVNAGGDVGAALAESTRQAITEAAISKIKSIGGSTPKQLTYNEVINVKPRIPKLKRTRKATDD